MWCIEYWCHCDTYFSQCIFVWTCHCPLGSIEFIKVPVVFRFIEVPVVLYFCSTFCLGLKSVLVSKQQLKFKFSFVVFICKHSKIVWCSYIICLQMLRSSSRSKFNLKQWIINLHISFISVGLAWLVWIVIEINSWD